MPMTRKPATTVTKVCKIIREFQYGRSFGITDMASKTDLLPSDVHRILTSLRASGYVEQDPKTKRYRLGLAFVRVGLTAFQHNELRQKARPLLMRLSAQIDATVYLGIYDDRELELFVIDEVENANTSASNFFHGHIGPEKLHCTALGKAILASLDHDTMMGAIEKTDMKRYTGHTITDINILEIQLEQIREVGYSVDRGEYHDGACCLASPVRDHNGTILGALSTSMPTRQFRNWDESDLAVRLNAVATTISGAISNS